ncbi:MAG: dockerin type I repeat-containing protein [Alloprevotella sp.]
MNRILFILCCLLIPWTARGQATYEGHYWFDDETELQPIGSFQGGTLHLLTEAGHLTEGFHTIHIQLVDTAGHFSPAHTENFYHLKDRSIKSLRYWFDNDTDHISTIRYGGGNVLIDVSKLEPGLHNVYLQIEDAAGNLSEIVYSTFYRMMRRDVLTWTYWFDGDEHQMTTLPYPGEGVMIDITDLSEGFHLMHNVVNDISQSAVETRMFVKVPQTEGVEYMTCICSMDGHLVGKEKLPANGGMIEWKMDVDSLDIGVHKAMFQAITPSGAASSIAERYFVREVTNRELGTMKCLYSIDNFKTAYQAGTMSNGLFHFDLDVSELEDGLHRLAYMLVSDNGITTPQKSAFFWKTPVGGVGITQYEYWLNNSKNVHRTKLDKRTNPFSLVSLLPVESEPIRSSCFHFELREGQPMMYAKNDFHISFYDVSGRKLDESKQYIDYNVSQPVTDLTPLETTQTFERPDSNCVAWFKFEAEKGDTIAFRSSQATSLQVFSPTGKEIYAVAEDKSVKYGGCHTWEDGTYYVAVHDVTGSKPDVTLDYMHMARYAVVSQDVYTVGNGGASTITFKGNGFDELESIYLEGPETITCDSIYHESNVETSAFFDFTDVATGKYDIHFTFKDGAKVLPANITVEEAKEITFTQQITFAKQYLRSRSNNYQVQITNNGNSTAYDVPVAIYIFTPELNDLNKVWIKEVDVYEQYKKRMPTLFDTDFANHYASVVNNEDYKPLFVTEDNVNYEPGLPAVHKAYINLTLRPNTTETFNVAINASTNACVHVWSPDTWETETHPMCVSNKRYKTIIHDTKCNIASIKAQRCEANRMLIANGQEPIYVIDDCPDIKLCPPPRTGGKSTPVSSFDPNEIYGYTSESGSRFMTDKVQQMDYRIEFENDTTFASASAHVVVIKDTLNANYFDLNSYSPRSIKIGDREESLDGSPQFVRTIDMRPQINAIAQVEGFYDKIKGIITYRFTSIDPMTMEPTDDVMQGFLPVNYDGKSGIGEVAYDVKLRQSFPDGTQIPNKASIIFDTNDPIETPLWVNTIDAVAPAGQVDEAVLRNDTTATIHCVGSDERSGVWKYEVYAQYGSGEVWEKVGECPADSAYIDFRIYDGMDYGFCALAVDSASNVEAKEFIREASLATYVPGDANMDGKVDMEDVVATVNYYLGTTSTIHFRAADVVKDGVVDMEDAVSICNTYLGTAVSTLRLTKQRLRARPNSQ